MRMKQERQLQFTVLCWLVCMVVAAFFRLFELGKVPLNDGEAVLALSALQLSNGAGLESGVNPVYEMLTAGLFFFFGPSSFLARLVPALAGMSLIGWLYLQRHHFGDVVAVLAACLTALSPTMIAASRQVDSPILSLALLLWAWAAFDGKSPVWAGVLLGLGLISGCHFPQGLLLAFICFALIWIFFPQAGLQWNHRLKTNYLFFREKGGWQAFLITLVAAGSGFFLVWHNLGSALAGWVDFIQGWIQPYTDFWGKYLIAILVYELFLVLFGVFYGAVSILRKNQIGRLYFISFLVMLGLVMAYPKRTMLDLVWAVFPLILFVAQGLKLWMNYVISEGLPALLLGILGFVLLVFSVYSELMALTMGNSGGLLNIRLFSMIGGIVLLLLIVLLISWAWSPETGAGGAVLGLVMIGGLYMIGMGWRATLLHKDSANEMLRSSPPVLQASWLTAAVEQVSIFHNGIKTETPVTIEAESPSLLWALNRFPVSGRHSMSTSDAMPVIINDQDVLPLQTQSYTGERFLWTKYIPWHTYQLQDWINWAVFRQGAGETRNLYLWVPTQYLNKNISETKVNP